MIAARGTAVRARPAPLVLGRQWTARAGHRPRFGIARSSNLPRVAWGRLIARACRADGYGPPTTGNNEHTMQIPGVHIETLHNPVRYTYAQIEKACAIAQMLNRGKLVLVEPPRR
jgi:hypothetical protein